MSPPFILTQYNASLGTQFKKDKEKFKVENIGKSKSKRNGPATENTELMRNTHEKAQI